MLILTLLALSPFVVKLMLEAVQQNDLRALNNKRKYDKVFLILSAIFIIFVMGFRDRFAGTLDTDNYCKGFIEASKNSDFFSYFQKQSNYVLV